MQTLAVLTTSAHTEGLGSGPYGLIFSLVVQFVLDVPASARFKLLGVPLTDKIFIYLAAAQFLFSSPGAAILPAVSGLLAGILFRVNFLGMRNCRLPSIVNAFFSRTLGPLLRSSRPAVQSGARRATLPQRDGNRSQPGGTQGYNEQLLPGLAGFGGMGGEGGGGDMFPQQIIPPPPGAVETMEAMGFPREQALRALAAANNDVNTAAHFLLQGGAV
eukprot:CAMPEP_0196591108 /NCGR_PEP_ID=MMETSP1081-20130531/68544_1 /TAXON_ID=36882 /ORGANISM="Pyramimonas amylifera, Strain CCMP720" /LENGTH=216 /DNA_ID=CAMNT_0041914375 /DNA_START=425 /DNA_END=1075 /DNA_ORIENTATION=-